MGSSVDVDDRVDGVRFLFVFVDLQYDRGCLRGDDAVVVCNV